MLRNQRFQISSRTLERGQIVFIPDVPKSYADVPQKTAALDPLYRRAAENYPKLLLIKRDVIAQRHLHRFARSERRLARRDRKAIPRTRFKTIIAAVDSIADQRPQFDRNRPFELYC